ncbi:MAG: restriction endonuclease subunit S [Gammaproteobacteria bacterium]
MLHLRVEFKIDDNGSLRDETYKSLSADVAAPYLLKPGDLLFARSGATAGKTFLYRESWGVCAYAGYLIRASVDADKASPEFAKYFTSSLGYWQWISAVLIQATIQNVSAEKYADMWLPLPPVSEQRAIADFLDRETGKIDALVTRIETAIERLREYRAALITAAVTGKVDVRAAATSAD